MIPALRAAVGGAIGVQMLLSALAALLTVAQGARPPRAPGDSARAVVAAATRAVESDSAAVVAARWRPRATAGDRAAQLGLATLARLTYDYAGAVRRYLSLLPPR